MELALGGDLKRVYKENPHLFGHLACARFYLAGVVLALEHLHGKKMLGGTVLLCAWCSCDLVVAALRSG